MLDKFLSEKYGKWIEYFTGLISFGTAFLYILSTYFDDEISWHDTFDIVVMSIFVVEYLLRLLAA